MCYEAKHTWRSDKEIDESIDHTLFQLQAKDYVWKKTLSVWPRRCYWTGDFIRPFTYAMVASYPRLMHTIHAGEVDVEHNEESIFKDRWVSMPNYIFLQLKGKL